jgi:hypothetical protein
VYVLPTFPMRATCPFKSSFFDLIVIVVFSGTYKSCSSPLFQFFTLPLLYSSHVQMFSSALTSLVSSVYILLWGTKRHSVNVRISIQISAETYFFFCFLPSGFVYKEYEVKSYIRLYGKPWPYVCFIHETTKWTGFLLQLLLGGGGGGDNTEVSGRISCWYFRLIVTDTLHED